MARISLIATDLDGTLLRNDGSISPRTCEAIRAAGEAGLHVVFVTARPPRHVRVLANQAGLGSTTAVCSNGAILYDLAADAFSHHEPLRPEVAIKVIEALRAVTPEVAFATEHGHSVNHEPHFPRIFESEPQPAPPRVGAAQMLCDETLIQLLAHDPGDEIDVLVERARAVVGELAEVRHSGGGPFIELGAPGVSKASGLRRLCAQLGIDTAGVAAFGDMPNDIPMLQLAGRGVAVANAHPDVLAAADEVTASNEDDGVARSIEAILEGR
jgi:Cof subfamily protein (haloacid dehalogenase superfamily)